MIVAPGWAASPQAGVAMTGMPAAKAASKCRDGRLHHDGNLFEPVAGIAPGIGLPYLHAIPETRPFQFTAQQDDFQIEHAGGFPHFVRALAGDRRAGKGYAATCQRRADDRRSG